MYSSDKQMNGIYRAIVMEATDYTATIYIPALHRDQMPFTNPNNPSDGVSFSGLTMKMEDYPVAVLSSMFVVFPLEVGDPVWVVFENGDANYPIIVGQLGSILEEGDLVEVLGGSGSSEGSYSTEEHSEGWASGGGTLADNSDYSSSGQSVDMSDWVYPMKSYGATGDASNFGDSRSGGARVHAARDLIAPAGTKVYASTSGTIIAHYYFYEGTNAIEVQNDDGTIIRYGETNLKSGLSVGQHVNKGQEIGYLPRNSGGTAMVHFEVYRGDASGGLTDTSNHSNYKYVPPRNYQRRWDLTNPMGIAKCPLP